MIDQNFICCSGSCSLEKRKWWDSELMGGSEEPGFRERRQRARCYHQAYVIRKELNERG